MELANRLVKREEVALKAYLSILIDLVNPAWLIFRVKAVQRHAQCDKFHP